MNIKVNSYLKFFVYSFVINTLVGCTGSTSSSNPTATGNKTYISSENDGIQECSINNDGSLSDCKTHTNELLTDPDGMALYFDIENKRPYMFISNYKDNTITSCEINEDGSIGSCFDSQAAGLHHPEELEVLHVDSVNFLLIGNETNGGVTRCTINAGATLSDCTSLIPDVNSNTALVTYTKLDKNTELLHTYLYVNTIDTEQSKQLLRCNIESSGQVHDCQYQATTYFENIKPGVIDAMSIHSNYMYMTFKDQNQILVCPINDDAAITDCNATNELIGPYEITFSNLGISNDGMPQIKAYITSLANNSIYTCDINENNGLPENCTVTNDIDTTAPRNIIASTNVGNIDSVVKEIVLQEENGNVQKADWLDNLTMSYRAFGRLIASPSCGTYLELLNNTSSSIKVDFIDKNVTIEPHKTYSYYYATDGSFNTTGKITHGNGTVDTLTYTVNKNTFNCSVFVKASGANVINIPYELWVSDTPKTTITVNNDATVAKHRGYFKTAAGGSLLAYATVFSGTRTDLENQALADLQRLGYGDFLEVTSLDIRQNTGIASASNNDATLLVYQDENSNGIKLLDDDGMPTNISYNPAFSKSSNPMSDVDLIDGKILLGYNKNTNTILIAYRGTANKANVFVDIVATEADWSLPKPETDPIINAFLTMSKVHLGFSVYRAVLFHNALVHNWIDSHSNANTEYLVTGHSLGGAAANLLSAYLLSDGVMVDKLNVVTFGQPAAGNRAFAAAYSLKGNYSKYYSRIINDYDPVGGITSPLGYEHYGTRVGLAGMTEGINTHSMDGYYNASAFYGPL